MLARLRTFLAEEKWDFLPHEIPAIPGSPGSVEHALRHRIAYGVIAVLLGLTGGFGNALISANTYTLQGALGLDPANRTKVRKSSGSNAFDRVVGGRRRNATAARLRSARPSSNR